MTANSLELAAQRLRVALDLYEAGEAMMVQRLRRENPSASDEEIEEAVRVWLRDRPGAELGDAQGRPVPWPRVSK